METYLKITYINDFIFCPLSIYYHELYGDTDPILYHDKPQIEGKETHKSIDEASYSTHRDILQGIDVYSDEYKLCGKIDTFSISDGVLTERKNKISKIYDGYVFQLYAQCLCLREMGYIVKSLRFWSKVDNKIYPVALPENDNVMYSKFINTLNDLYLFEPNTFMPKNIEKCNNCIYHTFCDRPIEE